MQPQNNEEKSCEIKKENCPAVAAPTVTLMEVLKDPEAVKALESLVTAVFVRHGKNAQWHRLFLLVCCVALISSVSFLSFYGKLDASAGVILGALAGYLFGKKDE